MSSSPKSSSYPDPSTTATVSFKSANSDLQCETYYSLWGDLTSEITPLICLHGGPGVPSHYLQPLGLLHQQFQIPVVTYDQIGCARSTHLPDKKGDTSFWTIELFIDELNNLLNALGIKRYNIFGHSWGGIIATEFALTQPPGLHKLILASAPARIQTRVEVSKRHRAEIPGNVAAIMERCELKGTKSSDEYRAAYMEYSKRHLCILDPFPECLVEAMTESAKDDTVSTTMHGGLVVTGSLKDYDAVPRLHEITLKTAPGGVLIINGQYDGAADEVVRPQFTKIEARVKWIKFLNSSHMPFLEEPQRFMEEIGSFLSKD
jgi:proline-specific peptidase